MPYIPTRAAPRTSPRTIVDAERRRALKDVGLYIQAKAAKYPPKADSASYKRTGTLGRSIAVTPVQGSGAVLYIEIGTNLHYAKYVEYGTGIYGPRGVPIKPKTAKFLAWKSTGSGMSLASMGIGLSKGKIVHRKAKDSYWIFAREVKGMQGWHFMEKAFKAPETQAYFKQRLERMFVDIRTKLTQT